jgi:hypothetical protein
MANLMKSPGEATRPLDGILQARTAVIKEKIGEVYGPTISHLAQIGSSVIVQVSTPFRRTTKEVYDPTQQSFLAALIGRVVTDVAGVSYEKGFRAGMKYQRHLDDEMQELSPDHPDEHSEQHELHHQIEQGER